MLTDRLVAHRGWQKMYPENTLLGITRAIEAGAHYIETDVMFSADGQPVLYHDVLMNRLSGRKNAIHLLKLESIERISAHEPGRFGNRFLSETIAPLSTVTLLLKSNPQVTLFVEVKKAGIHFMGHQDALNTIAKTLNPVRDQCVLISYDLDFIYTACRANWPRVGIVLEDWSTLSRSIVQSIEPDFIFCSERHLPENTELDISNSMLVVYEVADPERAICLYQRGVDMVETFDIGGMLQQLAHRAL